MGRPSGRPAWYKGLGQPFPTKALGKGFCVFRLSKAETTGITGCCVCTTIGEAAALPTPAMNSRRFIMFQALDHSAVLLLLAAARIIAKSEPKAS
jgi:hypothetical protein